MSTTNISDGYSIHEYVNNFFEKNIRLKSKVKQNLKHYVDGIITSHKKSMCGIKRASNLKIHVSNICRSLKKSLIPLQKSKVDLQKRVGKFIDKRSTFFISVDDTHAEKFGKKIYGVATQFDHTRNSFIRANTLVDCNVTSKKGDLF